MRIFQHGPKLSCAARKMSGAGCFTGQRRHIGLQQLAAIAACSHAFLGPNKRQKFIQDVESGDSVLVSSCSRLLEHMELDGSVGQLLSETVKAQHKVFRSGTGTVVILAEIWSRVALECLHRGITVSHIKAAMTRGLEVCLEAGRQSVVLLEDVSCRTTRERDRLKGSSSALISGGNLATEQSTGTCLQPPDQDTTTSRGKEPEMWCVEEELSQNLRLKLKHSRHFSLHNTKREGSVTAQKSYSHGSKHLEIVQVAQAVSHGCDASMNLVVEASKLQSRISMGKCCDIALNIHKLVTCPMAGLSEEHSRVVHGFVTLLSAEQSSVVHHLQEQTLNVALVNGDLTEKYRHVGFSRPANVTHTADHSNMTGVSLEELWIENAFKTLCKLSIGLVLVSGVVSVKLKDHCLASNILVIEGVRKAVLQDFSMTTGAVPISYVTQLNERCVGRGVKIRQWRECSSGRWKDESTAVSVMTASTSLVTAVITSAACAKLQSLEDQFWSCAHRLHHALADRKLLPGAGATELLCIHRLQKSIAQMSSRGQTGMENPHESAVLQLMAEGWMEYISTLMLNSGRASSKAEVWTAVACQLRSCEDGVPMCAERLWAPLKRQHPSDSLRAESGDTAVMEEETDVIGVYDNLTVKFEAWRRALDLVFLVMQSDTEIITGLNEGEHVYNDLMFL